MLLDARIEGYEDHGWRGAEGEGKSHVSVFATVDSKVSEPKVCLKVQRTSDGKTMLLEVDLEDLLLMAKGLAAGCGMPV